MSNQQYSSIVSNNNDNDNKHIRIHFTLSLRHNGRDSVLNHQPHDCLLNCAFRSRSKKTPKLRVTGLCAGNSPVTGEFPAQKASNAENVSIWWRHHEQLFRRNRWSFNVFIRQTRGHQCQAYTPQRAVTAVVAHIMDMPWGKFYLSV